MNFNSQICTTTEQSERLLALGLKKETADMRYAEYYIGDNFDGPYTQYQLDVCPPFLDQDIPAWSLHRLIEIIQTAFVRVNLCGWWAHIESKAYNEEFYGCVHNNLYDNLIDCIMWLIKEEEFNEDYMEEKK